MVEMRELMEDLRAQLDQITFQYETCLQFHWPINCFTSFTTINLVCRPGTGSFDTLPESNRRSHISRIEIVHRVPTLSSSPIEMPIPVDFCLKKVAQSRYRLVLLLLPAILCVSFLIATAKRYYILIFIYILVYRVMIKKLRHLKNLIQSQLNVSFILTNFNASVQ